MGTSPSAQKIGLALFLLFALLLGTLWQFFPLEGASKRLNSLPLKGEAFFGSILPLTERELHYLRGVDLIKRRYLVGGQEAYLYILDGTQNRHAVHDPAYCFRGGGWSILESGPFPLPQGDASLLTLEKAGEQKEALVWFSTGERRYSSSWRYWLDTTLRRLTLGRSGKEPVLIILLPERSRSLDWQAFFERFPALLSV